MPAGNRFLLPRWPPGFRGILPFLSGGERKGGRLHRRRGIRHSFPFRFAFDRNRMKGLGVVVIPFRLRCLLDRILSVTRSASLATLAAIAAFPPAPAPTAGIALRVFTLESIVRHWSAVFVCCRKAFDDRGRAGGGLHGETGNRTGGNRTLPGQNLAAGRLPFRLVLALLAYLWLIYGHSLSGLLPSLTLLWTFWPGGLIPILPFARLLVGPFLDDGLGPWWRRQV